MMGMQIGGINCVAPTCADDVANRSALQTLVNIASDYSSMERYILQPTNSVILSILASKDKTSDGTSHEWTLNGEPIPKVRETMLMAILRSKTTEDSAVKEMSVKLDAPCIQDVLWATREKWT